MGNYTKKKFDEFSKQVLAEVKKQIEAFKMECMSNNKREKEMLRTELKKAKESLEQNKIERLNWETEKKLFQEKIDDYKTRLDKLESRDNVTGLQGLESKIQTLENKEEQRDIRERKNNIIIIGAKFDRNTKEKKKEVKKKLKDTLHLDVDVTTAFKISEDKQGGDIVLAKLSSYEEKVKIMRQKRRLKEYGETFFINNDLTKNQLEKIKSSKREKFNYQTQEEKEIDESKKPDEDAEAEERRNQKLTDIYGLILDLKYNVSGKIL